MTTQQWDPQAYARNARFVSDLGAGVVELLAPQAGERILDLGCCDGALTETLVAAGCVVIIRTALADALARRGLDAAALDPWFFPTEDEYRARLEANGFTVTTMKLFPRPTALPGTLSDWLETFAQPFLAAVPGDD